MTGTSGNFQAKVVLALVLSAASDAHERHTLVEEPCVLGDSECLVQYELSVVRAEPTLKQQQRQRDQPGFNRALPTSVVGPPRDLGPPQESGQPLEETTQKPTSQVEPQDVPQPSAPTEEPPSQTKPQAPPLPPQPADTRQPTEPRQEPTKDLEPMDTAPPTPPTAPRDDEVEVQAERPSNSHGVSSNARGDLNILAFSFISNGIVLAACVVFFSFARKWHPEMYANNVRSTSEGGFHSAPFTPSDTFFGWISAGLFVTSEQIKATSGLDAALLMVYSGFCMKLLAAVGVPLIVILTPVHLYAPDGMDVDRLSTIGLNNVPNGSGIFILHAFVVWYVVLVTERMVYVSMKRFLTLRVEWLSALGPPRATTVLVEGLPESLRTDKALAEHFGRYFSHEAVISAHVVKHTEKLIPMVEALKEKRLALEKAVYAKTQMEKQKEEAAESGEKVPEELEEQLKQEEEACIELEDEVASLSREASAERERINEAASDALEVAEGEEGEKPRKVLSQRAREVCTQAGFVTFTAEREALLAMSARCSADEEDMVLSVPPSPSDVRYDDLRISLTMQKILAVLGSGAVFGMFVSYMPFIALISTLTQLQNLEKIPAFRALVAHAPGIANLIQGFLSTLGIVVFMSFLPTILMWIFRSFFALKADAWAQKRLQISYFWFLVLFVLLITALGASLLGRAVDLAKHPMEIAGVLADSLPNTTHFYLNYVVMQWAVHAMNLTRYIQLTKFLFYRKVIGDVRAVALSEPEDQDYYGLGARSARWSLDLILALVFCSITPLMTVVTFLNFLITRVVYGYLLTFAETRKHDLGGPFFIEQMKQVHYGLIIYILLMMGVFARRAGTWLPVIVAGLALLPVLYALKRIYGLVWEFLPLETVIQDEFRVRSETLYHLYCQLGTKRVCYVQPELAEEPRVSVRHSRVSVRSIRRSRSAFVQDQSTSDEDSMEEVS